MDDLLSEYLQLQGGSCFIWCRGGERVPSFGTVCVNIEPMGARVQRAGMKTAEERLVDTYAVL